MKAFYLNIPITLIFVLILTQGILAQTNSDKTYNIYTDTLLIINGKVINTDRIHVNREDLLIVDTFKINQKGLIIKSFTFSAMGLGTTIELNSNEPMLSAAMKNEITNKNSNFKFIYIKDIILQANDGRVLKPSLNNIKIIFNN